MKQGGRDRRIYNVDRCYMFPVVDWFHLVSVSFLSSLCPEQWKQQAGLTVILIGLIFPLWRTARHRPVIILSPPVGKIYLTKSGCLDNRVETDHRVEQNFHRICVYLCRECIRKTGFNRTLFFLLAKKHWIHHEMNRIKLTFFSRV